jgi:chromosome segregation ATPase
VKSDATLTLTIRDAKGEVVRTYSTSPNKEFVGDYPGGPSSDPLLSVKSGINRFVWDLRYPTVNGVEGVFIEGMYDGHRAVPGQYTAVLTYGNQSITTNFQVKADPRIKASEADYLAQHQLASKVEASVNTIHGSITQMRKARKQLEQLQEQTKEQHQYGDLHQQIASIITEINQWEAELVQTKAKSNDDIINYVNKLTADYIFLKGEMDANIPYVTKGQETRYQELEAIWQKYAQQLASIRTKVQGLNEKCKELKIPVVFIK